MEQIQISTQRVVSDFMNILKNKYPEARSCDLTRKIIKSHKDTLSEELKKAKQLGKLERKKLKDYDMRTFKKIKNDK